MLTAFITEKVVASIYLIKYFFLKIDRDNLDLRILQR
jgi:hypothetical protein